MRKTREEKKKLPIVPSHLVQTDISGVKEGDTIFSDMMFCILLVLFAYNIYKYIYIYIYICICICIKRNMLAMVADIITFLFFPWPP